MPHLRLYTRCSMPANICSCRTQGSGTKPEIPSEIRDAGDEVLCRSARCPRLPLSHKAGLRPAKEIMSAHLSSHPDASISPDGKNASGERADWQNGRPCRHGYECVWWLIFSKTLQ